MELTIGLQIFTSLLAHDDLSNWHPSVMKIKYHQCEYMVVHIIGAKCRIHGNSPIMIKLENGLELCRCRNPYGERHLDLIHLTYILKVKDIIRVSTYP
jgi:hypothetical protein